jgi:uncharacterized protein (TIGR03083 family)
MGDSDVRVMFTHEQDAAVALARELAPGEWDVPSLCDGWAVRDVFGHLARHLHPADWQEGIGLAGRRAARREREYADDVDRSIAVLASPAKWSTSGLKAVAVLNTCELVIHQEDVRRPLTRPRTYPEATLRSCLEFATSPFGNVGVADSLRRRGRALRLVATDLDWSTGSGPEVTGTGEALLLAIAGRGVAMQALTGSGAPILAARMPATTSSSGATPHENV